MVDGITRGKPFDLLPDLTFDENRSQEVSIRPQRSH